MKNIVVADGTLLGLYLSLLSVPFLFSVFTKQSPASFVIGLVLLSIGISLLRDGFRYSPHPPSTKPTNESPVDALKEKSFNEALKTVLAVLLIPFVAIFVGVLMVGLTITLGELLRYVP